MADLENIHHLLGVIEETIAHLNQLDPQADLDVTNVSDFCLAVNDILEYDRTAYNTITPQLGVNPATLNKFLKFRGKVRVHIARTLADRLRSYVRSLDQVTPARRPAPPAEPIRPTPAAPPAPLTFTAEQWKLVQVSSEMKVKIAAISSLLDTIIVQMQRSNAPPEQQILSEIERRQLVAVLETALAVLKAPVMEKALLTRAREGLNRAAAQAAEKQVEQGLGNASHQAARLLWDVIKGLFT